MPKFDSIGKFKVTTEYDVEREKIIAKISFQATVEPQDVAELVYMQREGMSIDIASPQIPLPER